ncbi:MAG TPA: hypothetical protein PKK43_01095 [Spirochaetota bacterium]|nr:hypothetical protein [Spirochaetota bacterium]
MSIKRKSRLIVAAVSGVTMFSSFAYLQLLFVKCRITAAQYTAAWTSFDASKITELNRYLVEKNTMGTYVYAHCIDFVFFISFGIFFYSLFMMISERMSVKGKMASAYRVFAWCAVFESVFDGIETSLVLFSTHIQGNIPSWLSYIHDPANMIKFLFFYGVILWGVVSLAHGTVILVRRGYAAVCG